MWKKLGVIMIALLSTFSVVYAMNQGMFAMSETVNPLGVLSEGDKIILGKDTQGDVFWDVAVTNIDNYLLATTYTKGEIQMCNENTNNTMSPGAGNPPSSPSGAWKGVSRCDYITTVEGKENSAMYEESKLYNQKFKEGLLQIEDDMIISQEPGTNDGNLDKVFVPNIKQIELQNFGGTGELGVTRMEQVSFLDGSDFPYITTGSIYLKSSLVGQPYVLFPQIIGYDVNVNYFYDGSLTKPTSDVVYGLASRKSNKDGSYTWTTSNLRPFSVIKKDETSVVIALDASMDDIALHEVSKVKTVQGDQSTEGAKKLRLYDSSILKPSLLLKNYKNEETTRIMEGSPLTLEYNGTTPGSDRWVSVVFINAESGEVDYYQRLEVAKNSGTIKFDTSSIASGEYNVAIFNEAFDETTDRPVSSSNLSDYKSIEVIERISDMTYNETPQPNDGKAMDHLETKVNVLDQQVAIAVAKTATTLIAPYDVNYEIINVEGETSDVPFEFRTSNGSVIKDNTGHPIIFGKADVNPGVYKFRVRAYDNDGYPMSMDGIGVDSEGNEVTGTDSGFISVPYTIVIYPNKNQLKFTQYKNDMDTVDDPSDD